MHTFDVQIDPEMMRRAWNVWFFRGRRLGRLAIAFLILLAAIVMEVSSGHFGTMSVIFATVLGFTILIYGTAYFVGVRRAIAKREAIVDGRASYTLTDETIEAKSSLGSVALAWSAISEVRRHRDLVLLGFRGAGYSTIPSAQIPEDALIFLVERAKANGAKITQL